MELKIKLSTCNVCDDCKITVQDKSSYLQEDHSGIVKGRFKFSETMSLDVLLLNKSSEPTYYSPTFTDHSSVKDTTLHITEDGWYSLIHVVLPSIEWFNVESLKLEGSALELYSIVYYTDGNKVYKYIGGSSVEVDLSEILEINPINTTISKTLEDFVSICFLRKCYLNLCKQILNNRGFSPCWKNNKIDSELIYKRDLVWMAINVIKYLTECKQLAEVQRLVEVINGCNGLCSSLNFLKTTNGCGCSK